MVLLSPRSIRDHFLMRGSDQLTSDQGNVLSGVFCISLIVQCTVDFVFLPG